jgi:hypothetical protein
MNERDKILHLVYGVMANELEANIHKGDNWNQMTRKEFLFQTAIMNNDIENVKQFTGDILNTCGFLLDSIDKKLICQPVS